MNVLTASTDLQDLDLILIHCVCLHTGETAALASVSGPIEVRLAVEHPSRATFEVTVRPLSGIPGTESKALAANIRNILLPVIILTQHPRTLIQLVVQALSPQQNVQLRQSFAPSLIAACINASMLALLNASSFPLRGLVCAVAVGKPANSNELTLDPSEEGALEASGCFAFMFGGGEEGDEETLWTEWKVRAQTSSGAATLEKAREIAREGARQVYATMKESLAGRLAGHHDTEMKSN